MAKKYQPHHSKPAGNIGNDPELKNIKTSRTDARQGRCHVAKTSDGNMHLWMSLDTTGRNKYQLRAPLQGLDVPSYA